MAGPNPKRMLPAVSQSRNQFRPASPSPAIRMASLVHGWPALLLATALLGGFAPARAQLAPGPYEFLPFEDGFILEAFKDLNPNSGAISDWSGWSGSSWISPNAYDNHIGTDFSVQTGTPLFAAAAGTVTEVVTSFPRDDHSTYSGNFVRIAVDSNSPNGESLDLLYLHMLQVTVTNGQRVIVGDPVGLSDNTGNSTSEHVHLQTEVRGSGAQTCPLYWGHFKYPIIFNPTGTMQVGRIIRVAAPSTPIRTDRLDTSAQITTAHQNQLYFCSYAKRGYYHVFIPNDTAYRSGWIRATDAYEVFAGTVIQTMPDNVTFTQLGQLTAKFPIRSAPNDAASQLGQIVFGGGRFVADQITNGYYRIALPGASATWGWVKPTSRMVVYPQLTNPSINLAALPKSNFPIRDAFAANGKSMFGRPKFNRSTVKSFSPSSPGGDGKALFVTDQSNHGDGLSESVLVGRPGHRNYYVQCDVYFNYSPAYLANGAWDRFGIFLRDDGFAGLDTTFEGAGNAYAFLWDCDDGRLRACKLTDAVITDFFSPAKYLPSGGWHTLRIEARTNTIKFFLDGVLQVQTNETTHATGQCGLGYSWHPGSPANYPAARGAYFDNFIADTLEPSTTPVLSASSVVVSNNGSFHFSFTGAVSNTYEVQGSTNLLNWDLLTAILLTNGTAMVSDDSPDKPQRFYRVRWIQ